MDIALAPTCTPETPPGIGELDPQMVSTLTEESTSEETVADGEQEQHFPVHTR